MQELKRDFRQIDFAYSPRRFRRSHFMRILSALFAIIGGLFATAILCRSVEQLAAQWSPTETARFCFPYPELRSVPEKEELRQLLLSTAFFGNDALYFDAGEENTGKSELLALQPSGTKSTETPQTPLTEPQVKLPAGTNIYTYDESKRLSGQLALLPYDLSCGANAGEVLLSNTTEYTLDVAAHLAAEYPIKQTLDDQPLVLILHTHGTEAFAPEGAVSISPNAVMRSTDRTENIVAVGAVMAELLNDAGIPTLHCEIMHDADSYQRSYTLAADTIQKYLTEYPSIQYVFDVHRDAIVRENGDYIRPITLLNGEIAAQIMLLVGTDEKGADHPNWSENFTVAAKLQSRLTEKYEKFARPINIRGASFNEQFTTGSLLIEIGSAGNTLSEAKTAAKYLTYAIIDMIKENTK